MNEKIDIPNKKVTLRAKLTKYVPYIILFSCILLGFFFFTDYCISRYYFIKHGELIELSSIGDYAKFCISLVVAVLAKRHITKNR